MRQAKTCSMRPNHDDVKSSDFRCADLVLQTSFSVGVGARHASATPDAGFDPQHIRVLLWYWGRRGAGGQLTSVLANALRKRSDVVLSLSVSRQSEMRAAFRQLGLPLDEVPTYAGPLGFLAASLNVRRATQRLVAQARSFRADVVVSVMTHLWTPLVAPALQRAGIAYVPMIHDAAVHPGDVGLLWGWRLRRELAAASMAVTFSRAVERQVRALRPELPLARVTLGAHLPGMMPHPAANPAPLPAGPDFLLFGRLRRYKGLDLLRDAFQEVRERHPTARLRIVGQGAVDKLAPGLASLPGVTVEQRWVDEAEIPALMAAADVVVLPYREASQSGVVPIALACGVPVVATAVGGLAEQIEDGVNGAVVATPSAPALAAAMLRLCDASLRARLRRGAQGSGATLSDWDGHAAALVAALRAGIAPPVRADAMEPVYAAPFAVQG